MKYFNWVTVIVMVLSLLMVSSCNAEKKITTEKEIAKAIFKTMQNGDIEKFSTYIITEEKMNELAKNLNGTTPKEKSIKKDMVEELNVQETKNETLQGFQKVIDEAKSDKLDLKKAIYQGIVMNELRFEIPNLKCSKIRFGISFDKSFYIVRLDLFNTGKDIFVYDVKMEKHNKVAFFLTAPTKNSIVIKHGESIDVKIDFDAEAANKVGAWIESKFDGGRGGMLSGTTIESPYTNKIPSKPLTVGKHTMIYRLHPSGSKTYRALGEVILDIEVK